MDAAALARAVALADHGAQVSILDREGNETTGSAGDVPGERAAEPGNADVAGRVRRDGVLPGALVDEQQPGGADETFQDADGGHDLRNRDPRGLALHACGQIVAVLVASGLELPAAEEVPTDTRGLITGAAEFGVRAAADVQGEDYWYWWRVLIPTRDYCIPRRIWEPDRRCPRGRGRDRRFLGKPARHVNPTGCGPFSLNVRNCR